MSRVQSVQELIERTQGMPLEKMRFFINEDRQEPRCFGIYHDEATDRWVVYKNKADGSRAVRYNGPDEGFAANEIWQKIQSEIGLRRVQAGEELSERQRKAFMIDRLLTVAIIAVVGALFAIGVNMILREPDTGYYLVDDAYYYYQDDDWYIYGDDGWGYYDAPDDNDWYRDGYCGADAPEGFGDQEAFEQSEYYEPPRESDDDDDYGDSSLFSSWDSDSTDWDSDW